MANPTEISFDTPDGTFAGLDFGGSGPDILLVHQVTANAQVWAPLGRRLTAVGHVVAVDLRGHGRTDPDLTSTAELTADLARAVRELGLSRPLVVAEGLDVLCLAPDMFEGLDPRGFVIIGDACGKRGDEARNWYAEQYDDDAVQVWVDRFDLFASGRPDEKDAFVERVTRAATDDWLTSGVDVEQWRSYLERAIRDDATGWQRRPTRAEYSVFSAASTKAPLGLDLYERLPAPLLLLDSSEQVSAPDLAALRDYCAGRDDREIVVIDGGGVPELLSPEDVTHEIGEFLARHA